MLQRLGRFCAHHHRIVIVVWLALLIGAGVAAVARNGQPKDEFSVPGTQSQQALDLLSTEFPSASGAGATVVFKVSSGALTDATQEAAVNATLDNIKKISGVSSVSSPFAETPTTITWDEGTPSVQTAKQAITPDGQVGFASVTFDAPITSADQATSWFDQLQQAAQPATQAGIDVTFGGAVVDAGNPAPPGVSEYSKYIGLGVAVIILLFAFGSAVSMSVPIGTAVVSVTISTFLTTVLEASFTVGSIGPVLGDMLGLAVCIDYSLFIVSKYRSLRDEGQETLDAVGHALGTAGTAVLFAAIAVCLALCGLILVGIPYITQVGFVAAGYVVMSMLAALTLVPALLGAIGNHINGGRIFHRDHGPDFVGIGARWAGFIDRRRGLVGGVALVILVVLILPVRSMTFGLPDDGDIDPALTQQQSFQLIDENFGPGQNGSLLLAIDLPTITDQNMVQVLDAFEKLQTAVAGAQDVARVSLPIPNNFPTSSDPSAMPTAAIMQVVPTVAPNDPAATTLVENLRNTVIPQALEGTAIPASNVYVGGQTAINIDMTDKLIEELPIYILAVVATAFVLLLMAFRSVYVAGTAAIMNLLSIGAAYGVLVAVFQWGWAKDAIGLVTTLPIVPFVPVMMFAVLFGLSMDYEVFLISRIREHYLASGDAREAVRTGLSTVARVIVVAAAIMMSVFASFVPNPDPEVKMIGFGLTIAVLIDVTLVRMALVPASLQLLPKANWWFPRWLDKILPKISVE